ncbi:MAG: DUF4118 domain-containing protein [Acidobacteria bacterium]|nr:DUF4118 domain-containing protein [Acidobacteriota bacterium]
MRKVSVYGFRVFRSLILAGLLLAAAANLPHVNATTSALLFVLVVLCFALLWGRLESLVAAVVAGFGLDYWFLPPKGSPLRETQHWISLLAFCATALATVELVARVRRHQAEALRRRDELDRMREIAGAISGAESAEDVVRRLASALLAIPGVEAAAVYERATGRTLRFGGGNGRIEDALLRGVAGAGPVPAGGGSGVGAEPVVSAGEAWGSIGLASASASPVFLKAVAERLGNAVAKVRIAESVKEVEDARREEELKSAILDALAHEVRGPLGSIKIAASTLLSDHPGNEQQRREMLTIIREEVDRMDRRIDEAASVRSAAPGEVAVQRAPCAPEEIARGALEEMRTTIGRRPAGLNVSASLPEVYCDAATVRHVIKLLLDNALKYSPAGSPIAISLAPCETGSKVLVAVSDAGPGVARAERCRIFEKQYRGARHRDSVPGMGMGLSSARRLVESQGGEIWVDDAPGGGAMFCFTLPVCRDIL